jgi:hypothetical protein
LNIHPLLFALSPDSKMVKTSKSDENLQSSEILY